ncbi:MAG: YciI family protein [Myxococcota bacterium]|nr:YciI family protein [Myxococcota bacterium]
MIGRDGPRGAELRKLHRPAHLEGLEGLEAEGKIRHAGPLLDGEGRPCGSLIVFEADDLAAARALAARDPYVVEGIFASHEVLETKVVFPRGET